MVAEPKPVLPLMTSPSAPQPACFPIAIQPAFVGNEPEMCNFLADCRLPNNYYKVLMDAGWDDLNYMKGVDENFLKAELKQIHMKPGHVAKFIDQLKKLAK